MKKKYVALSIGLVFLLVLWSAMSAGAEQKAISEGQILKTEGLLPDSPVSKDCSNLSYYGELTWIWPIPDEYGDDLFNIRFTAVEYGCTLTTSWILMYVNAYYGSPGMRVYLWDDDGTGLPGNKLDSVDFSSQYIAQLYADVISQGYNAVWVKADWTTTPNTWIFDAGEEFHVGWTMLGDPETDLLGCISDDGEGPHSGEERASEWWQDHWGSILDDWGTDYVFCMRSEVCCAATGACCYDLTGPGGVDAACIMTSQDNCENILGGVYQGDNTQCSDVQACCLPGGECIDADSLCCLGLGGNPLGTGTQCDAPQACCLSDGSCINTDTRCCLDLGGSPQGAGTSCGGMQACCLPDGDCINADSLCCADVLGGIPQGAGTQCSYHQWACCLPSGECVQLDSLCCEELGGVPQGEGSWCFGPKPCCLPDGGCHMLDPLCCDELGGVPSPIGASTCLGDTNCNQINDACEGGWQPGDSHKMHFPQLPDEDGWDVQAFFDFPGMLCDDWTCSADGPILDLHFWGSWKNEHEAEIMAFDFVIYSNLPEGESPTGYSVPDEPLWHFNTSEIGIVRIDSPTMQGWYDPDPWNGDSISNDHQSYYQYNVYIPEEFAFYQTKDSVYWLCVSAMFAYMPAPPAYWGWKSSEDHYLDNAVWTFHPFGPGHVFPEEWMELHEPGSMGSNPISNGFHLGVDPQGIFMDGFGDQAYGEGWYYYETSGWWNIWFYDHPFTYSRWKEITIEFNAMPLIFPDPAYLEVAINWSTDDWSLDQPPGDSAPPLPGVDEGTYIGRHTVFAGSNIEGPQGPFTYTIPDYNPEWVSVDVKGYNFMLDGFITHDCIGPQPLDLSFVVTSDTSAPRGACCYDPTGQGGDLATCVRTTQYDCETYLGGFYMGDGSQCGGVRACCLPGGECIDVDSLCCIEQLGGSPQDSGTTCGAVQACCINDGCEMLDSLCCLDLGGVPQGPGSQCGEPEACCLPGGDCVMIDALCCDDLGGLPQGAGTQCTNLKPCCMGDGSCEMLDPLCCDDEGGVPSPIGASTCLGDTNSNQINDACEGGWQEGDPHKMHYPQLPDEDGWGVNATYDGILCDDWTCSGSGPIADLHFWGSWKNGLEGQVVGFEFLVYSNIPEDQSPTGYSVPRDPLWTYYTEEFGIVAFDPQTTQGWYDPWTGDSLFNDHQSYFQYNVYIPEELAFHQEKDSVYWLCLRAHVAGPAEPAPYWGWKSSEDHYLDNAVFARQPFVPEPYPPEEWIELYVPSNSISNAFSVEVDFSGWLVDGAGQNAFGDGWYFYDQYQWWNIWFYDHPFTYDRSKEITLEFDAFMRTQDSAILEVAVNWSTDVWSLDQPPTDSAPPLPGVNEDLYIGRQTIFLSETFDGHYGPFTFTIPDYNPEWVSVDVRGYNYIISNGLITHECLGPRSLDLSFVITNPEICDCIPGDADGDGTHLILDVTYIINYLYKNGPAPVPYASCSGDADCDCSVLILDVTYLINYLYKNGAPPCSCEQWVTNCGPLK